MEIIRPLTSLPEWSAAARRLQTILLFFSIAACGLAQQQPADSIHTLQQVEVKAAGRARPRIATDGSVALDASMVDLMPRFFGEADLTRLMLEAAGVTTISSYSSGTSIDGMDYSQNLYLLNSLPVEFPYHFGGIFSTFNASHYPRLRLFKSSHPTGMPDCLGGIVDISGHTDPPRRFSGTANIGMTASSATLRLPVGRVTLEGSARLSYIDALYKPLLDSDDTGISYSFYDVDFAATWHPDSLNSLRLFGHLNNDRMGYDDSNFAMDTRLRWTNAVAGINWQGRASKASAGFSRLGNRLAMAMPNFALTMPSSINRWSASGSHAFAIGNVALEAGAAASYVDATLQDVTLTGYGSESPQPRQSPRRHAATSKLWAEASIPLAAHFQITAGLAANALFGHQNYHATHLDPRIALTWRRNATSASLALGRYHQYVHTIGFSEIGMASNFKIPASRECPPQQSLAASLTVSHLIAPLGLKINADAYFKRVLNQPEYLGGVISLLQPGYSAETYIFTCSGYNTGGSLTLTRDFHALSASASYALAIARRRMPGSREWFTASSEIRHSINLSASYRLPGNRWTLSAAWAFASGRPVTPVRAAYFIGERLMVEYGRRNSARLPDFHRLDLAAAFHFSTPGLSHTLAMSLINAYGHRNIEICSFAFNTTTGTLRRRDVASLYRFLPSLSYTIQF